MHPLTSNRIEVAVELRVTESQRRPFPESAEPPKPFQHASIRKRGKKKQGSMANKHFKLARVDLPRGFTATRCSKLARLASRAAKRAGPRTRTSKCVQSSRPTCDSHSCQSNVSSVAAGYATGWLVYFGQGGHHTTSRHGPCSLSLSNARGGKSQLGCIEHVWVYRFVLPSGMKRT